MNNTYKIGIIGIGFVGNAIKHSLELKKKDNNIIIKCYDKYIKYDTFEELLEMDIIYLCLPTLFNIDIEEYDKTSINEVCERLSLSNYKGYVLLKSTVEPNTTLNLNIKYNLNIIHNPEFLTARTAFENYHNQKHIVLGFVSKIDSDKDYIKNMYLDLYPNATISICTSTESEMMKLFVNNFYAMKVQIFTEFYLLCNKIDVNYDIIKNMMLNNGWINPMHTNVPGPDGHISYGGMCFIKDTMALNSYMKKQDSSNMMLEACILERNKIRN